VSESIQIAPDVLYKLYVTDELSKSEIAHKLGLTYAQARYRLAKFSIPMRKLICCSWECGWVLRLKQLHQAQQKRLAKHPRIEKICPICGQHFAVNFSSRNRRKYCSDTCKGVAWMLGLAQKSKPTNPEQTIIGITDKYFPQFKYNGNGNLGVTLARMVPDFVNVNGKKQVIEVFGDYHHTVLATNWKKTELGKKMAYNSVGYDCLVLWQSEIKSKSEEELVEIIRDFSSKRHKREVA